MSSLAHRYLVTSATAVTINGRIHGLRMKWNEATPNQLPTLLLRLGKSYPPGTCHDSGMRDLLSIGTPVDFTCVTLKCSDCGDSTRRNACFLENNFHEFDKRTLTEISYRRWSHPFRWCLIRRGQPSNMEAVGKHPEASRYRWAPPRLSCWQRWRVGRPVLERHSRKIRQFLGVESL